MTEKEFYDQIGGSYEEARARLMRDALIRRFVLKFRDDPGFGELQAAAAAQDWDAAFRAAHSLKGVALNLAFARLGGSVSALTDLLRPQNRPQMNMTQVDLLLAEVEQEAAAVYAAIDQLAQG